MKTVINKFPDELLEHISGIIADTKSSSEITRFFNAAGYSEFIHNGCTKKWFVLECLRNLNERTDGPYHICKIIEKLADPKQYLSNPTTHTKVVGDLNRSLVFHGIQVNNQNKVITTQDPAPSTPPQDPNDKPEVKLFNSLRLYHKITEVSENLFRTGHYSQAIFEAFKAVNIAVKTKSGVLDKDGQSLMSSVFSGNPPLLALNSMRTQSEKDEQDGFKFIFIGAMSGIRNPKAHENVVQTDPYRTLHYLVLASLLLVRIEEAVKTK